MLNALLAPYRNLPDVWGEGAIFAFSGLDGETCAASEFVATYAREPYGLLIHTPRRRLLEVALPERGTVRAATGDVLAVETARGPLLMAYSAWHTLVGVAPPDARLELREEGDPAGERRAIYYVPEAGRADSCLELLRDGPRFALAFGRSTQEARQRAQAGLAVDAAAAAGQRLASFKDSPALPHPARDRLLKKCLSVMKVNTLAQEGLFQQSWSTPDRVPHKHCWLWDSVFHSLAMDLWRPALAWDFLKAVLDSQREDGLIPIRSGVAGRMPELTQPPLLAWGVWTNFEAWKNRATLEYALPRLEAYLAWNQRHRDRNGNGLLEWLIEGGARCRSGESGLDNSPRFDSAAVLDAVDFSTFQAREFHYAARIARELGRPGRAAPLEEQGRHVARQVHELLWDEAAGLYVDRGLDGRLSPVQAVSGFLPLLLDDLPRERVDRLVAALDDPRRFKTAFPIPSVSISDPEWCTDMWRGATWLNFNYLIILGLKKHGRKEEAARLTEQTVAFVQKYYERAGVLFEFFDAKDERPPWACDRKGPRQEPYDFRRKYDAIRDYHWTAAVTARLLLEE